MEDDNGLELSLGLSLCRSSAKSKDKSDNSSDTRTDEDDRSNKLINDFKNFLEVEQAKGDGKQHAADGGSSSQTEDGLKRSNVPFGLKDESDKPIPEGFPFEFSAIRPGTAAYLKFGGCDPHSHPSLPWVSTKGPGPNGKTISGVTYRNGATQIKIVCACHGSHLTPEEFIRHASGPSQLKSWWGLRR